MEKHFKLTLDAKDTADFQRYFEILRERAAPVPIHTTDVHRVIYRRGLAALLAEHEPAKATVEPEAVREYEIMIWVPEDAQRPGWYAPARATDPGAFTNDLDEARRFENEAECAAWCTAHSSAGWLWVARAYPTLSHIPQNAP